MTLEEKLKEIDEHNVSADGCRRPCCVECAALLAALRRAIEQRDHVTASLCAETHDVPRMQYAMDKGNAELLAILNGEAK